MLGFRGFRVQDFGGFRVEDLGFLRDKMSTDTGEGKGIRLEVF